MSKVLSKKFRGNFFIDLIGVWHDVDGGFNSIPVSGIAYYISPPRGLNEVWIDPVHIIVYLLFVLGTCGFFSRVWIEISGQTAKAMAKNLV